MKKNLDLAHLQMRLLTKLGGLILLTVIYGSLLCQGYSTEVEYMSLLKSHMIVKPWTVPVFGPSLVKDKLECLNRCNRDPQCRVVDYILKYCTHYRIDNWNFTVSQNQSSTIFVKVVNDQPMIKTYNYYSMVVLCKENLIFNSI